MAVASSIELNDVGIRRSLDELEVDRRDASDALDGVRERLSLRVAMVREPRLGGITTGVVLGPWVSFRMEREREPEGRGVNGFICSNGFCGVEVKRNALGTIIVTTAWPPTVASEV